MTEDEKQKAFYCVASRLAEARLEETYSREQALGLLEIISDALAFNASLEARKDEIGDNYDKLLAIFNQALKRLGEDEDEQRNNTMRDIAENKAELLV